MVEREVEIHYGPKFANEIRKEGVEKTLQYWEELTDVPLKAEFSPSGGLLIKEDWPTIDSQGITATREFTELVRKKNEKT